MMPGCTRRELPAVTRENQTLQDRAAQAPVLALAQVLVLALATTCLPLGCGQGTSSASNGSSADAASPAPAVAPVAVRAMTASRGEMQPWLELLGRLETIPERTAVVAPRVSGQLQQLLVVPGDQLQQGQVLGHLDPDLYQAAVDRAQAQVQIDAAALARLEHGTRPQEIEVARQDLAGADSAVESLTRQLNATRDLRAHDEVAAVRVAQMESELAGAEAQRAAASAHLELALAGSRSEDIEAARGALAASRADLDAARSRLSYCTVSSPIAGTLTVLAARAGMSVDTTTELARVEDLSRLFVRVRLPRRGAGEVLPGTVAQVRVSGSAAGAPAVMGSVARLAAQADPASGERTAWIAVDNMSAALLPGVACSVRIRLPPVPDAISIPVAAVADRSGTLVTTVVRDGKAYEVELQLGITSADRVQVLKGVAAGELVAVQGGYGLPDGCPVTVEIASAAAPVER